MFTLIVRKQKTDTAVCNFHIKNHRTTLSFCPEPLNVSGIVQKAKALPELILIVNRYPMKQIRRLDPTVGIVPEFSVKNLKDLDLDFMKIHKVILSQRDNSSQCGVRDWNENVHNWGSPRKSLHLGDKGLRGVHEEINLQLQNSKR